ncbi:MerR family transcriptional regulator [Bacillus subtilis]|uniref:MerR family transcriptional regulator n=1 Tax=Bacillus subtilis TaxID=1423 RepID=UPI00224E54D3|nr:MerR family transcriptional regulator [Bacillus subtilis]MCX4074703.1 MerR family transcriptional regulator [Bacillus subtilis]
MADAPERGEYGFFSKDVAKKLNITTSSLRRWSIELEKYNYIFSRNDKDQRIYYKNDIKILEALQKLLSSSIPLNSAVKNVIQNKENYKESISKDDDAELLISKNELRQLIGDEVKSALEEERETFLKVLNDKMNNVIERRDRELLYEISKNREQKLLEAAATAETKKEESFWKRLFTKKK